jgi:hypothetical protein
MRRLGGCGSIRPGGSICWETVHRITSQARHTVVKRIAKEVEKVEGKERILVRIAEVRQVHAVLRERKSSACSPPAGRQPRSPDYSKCTVRQSAGSTPRRVRLRRPEPGRPRTFENLAENRPTVYSGQIRCSGRRRWTWTRASHSATCSRWPRAM